MKKEKCFFCNIKLNKKISKYKGIEFEVFKCPKCKKEVLDEEQSYLFAVKLEAKMLEKEYTKKPIKVGNSIGLLFPKAVTEVFNLKKKKLKIIPDIKKNIIELHIK